AELADVRFLEHLGFHTLVALRDVARRVREMRRRADVRGAVAEVSSQVAAGGDCASHLDAGTDLARARAALDAERQLCEPRGRIRLALELVETVDARARRLDAMAGGIRGLEWCVVTQEARR